ncbi:glycosyltransferase [Epilithonimonas sp.]|uniref:glycosyltransferase n=1 Tax=Epilithonimonas sp. TaxID=2894511 RepID=UPI002FDEB051
MKNLLFITWDGPQTSYMEGLFMPIFQEIAKQGDYKFHVIQFTWADHQKIAHTQAAADKMGITYTAWPVLRKPNVSIGSLLTVLTSAGKIKKYIRENNIHILMPRSTFPAMIVNQFNSSFASRAFFPFRGLRSSGSLSFRGFRGKLIFDADGLPIEERIDFAGLKKESFQYKLMKSAETTMLKSADAVITRSQKAIDIHIAHIGESYRSKFSVVFNGRDKNGFTYQPTLREKVRQELGLKDELLFVYAGSLGPQYCLNEMLEIFQAYAKKHLAKFLILTGNTEFAEQNILSELKPYVIIKSMPAEKVSFYLNGGDVAFGLRKPTFSMQGVAPIKLGEYLLCGLPVIASKGIGDTERILENFEECYLYDHSMGLLPQIERIKNFVEKAIFAKRNNIAQKAQHYFSLEAAAESYIKTIKM